MLIPLFSTLLLTFDLFILLAALSNAFSAPVAKKDESQFQTIINRAVTNAAITEEKLNAATLATARKTNQA